MNGNGTTSARRGVFTLGGHLWPLLALWVAGLLGSTAAAVQGTDPVADPFADLPAEALRRAPYSERTLELAAELPVQDGGRVKPLSTLADFALLQFNGKRKVRVELPGAAEPQRIDSVEWLLDTLFFPQQAQRYRHFLVRDDELLHLIGLDIPGRKRADRYSYAELEPARAELMRRAEAASKKDQKELSRHERDVLVLASNVREFEDLFLCLEFTRVELDLGATEFLRERFPESVRGVVQLYPQLTELRAQWDRAEAGELPAQEAQAELAAAQSLMVRFGHAVDLAGFGPGFVAPLGSSAEEPAWFDAGEILRAAAQAGDEQQGLPLLARLEAVERAKADPAAFEAALAEFAAGAQARAEARGEYGKVPLEVLFYRIDFFVWSLALFLLGFLAVAATWLSPARPLTLAAWICSSGGLALLVAGITMRCILRSRPPVSTLYETILFISAIVVGVALFIEWTSRYRLALGLGSALGAAGMFLSLKYELKEAISAGDTMPSLVAVLDTNFWLATHVTTVLFGYAAGLLAAGLAHLWLFGRMFGFRGPHSRLYSEVTRWVYGVTCFGLLFSVVGTILGGIWANYSWGRFWGWDPKENGALMIVLWQLLILHARLGGYVRQFGLNLLAILGGPIVAFSWWGVNLLGVGLHSYGFTSDVQVILHTYYWIEAGVVAGALVWYYLVGREAANGGRAAGSEGAAVATAASQG
jgi:ABC-type transport system involved in cytochrome c biogenesis permease subunit